jgi:hypothetical protein
MATWTDAAGDGLWTNGADWNIGVVPNSASASADLVGFNSAGQSIPGPTIPAGTPITLWGLTAENGVGRTFAADTLTISSRATLTIDQSLNTRFGGIVNWQAGNLSLASFDSALFILDGTQATFSAGAITGSSSSVGNVYVRGMDANNTFANITFSGSFSQLGVNLILGDPVAGGKSTAEVQGNLPTPISLSNGAVITLNGQTNLTLDSPTGGSDVGIKALSTSSFISGTLGGFTVTAGNAGTGTKIIYSPAVIGGSGTVTCNFASVHFAQDANGNSIKLTSGNNITSLYQQAPNTAVVCDGNVTITSGTVYFASAASPAATTLQTPTFTVTGANSALIVGDQNSANYISLHVFGNMVLSSTQVIISTSGTVDGPIGDEVSVTGNVTYSNVLLTVYGLTPWAADQSWNFLLGSNITTAGNNTIDKEGNWKPPVFTIVQIADNGNIVALALNDF